MKKMRRQLIFSLMLVVGTAAWGQRVFYVSPQGNDRHEGSQSAPWQTFDRAVSGVRTFRAAHPGEAVEVRFADGVYPMTRMVRLGAADSGTPEAPIVYRAMDGAHPVFSGGIRLKDWKLADAGRRKSGRLPESVVGRVYVCPLPRTFNRNLQPVKTGQRVPLNERWKRIDTVRTDLICNNRFQTLARYPNRGFLRIGKVLSQPDGQHPDAPIRFACDDARVRKWTAEPDVCLGGYWCWDWCDEYQRAEAVTADSGVFTLKPPSHDYGYRTGASFWGLNLLCELDSVSEYYVDREAGRVYWYPEEGTDPNRAEVALTHFSDPYMVEMNNCSHVTLEGLTFRDGATVGVHISGGEDVKVASCRFLCFSESAFHIDGGKSHRITGCVMKHFGERVMQIKGGDRRELIPAGHCVDNNIVQDFSIIKRTYEPAVYFNGTGLRIAHNYFSDCPSSALRIDGSEVDIEYNEFVRLVKESDDQGVIDMWFDLANQGVRIRHNYFQDIKGGTLHGSAAVRLDDMISGVVVSGNIFNRAGFRNFGAVQIHGGKENLVENNLFYGCLAAVSFTPWSRENWLSMQQRPDARKRHYEDARIDSEKYLARYPALRDLNANINCNFVRNNLIVNCSALYLREGGYNRLAENHFIDRTDRPVSYFCQSDVLRRYGMLDLERDRMGVEHNVWMDTEGPQESVPAE